MTILLSKRQSSHMSFTVFTAFFIMAMAVGTFRADYVYTPLFEWLFFGWTILFYPMAFWYCYQDYRDSKAEGRIHQTNSAFWASLGIVCSFFLAQFSVESPIGAYLTVINFLMFMLFSGVSINMEKDD